MNYKKILHNIAKVLFSLLLAMPILGALGIFPEPTRDLYHNDIAFSFIRIIMHEAVYINWLMAIVHALSLAALWSRREALAALLELPIVLNVVGFHAFLDGGLFTAGAISANIYFALTLYFLWFNRRKICQVAERE